jgi:hypothetical protein
MREKLQATEATIDLKEHPIMLTLQDSISGNGFLARITMSGRTLMRKEDDGKWWMYGVRPAGIAASGENIEDAFLRFRSRYKEILFDIAQESRAFEDFSSEVDAFSTRAMLITKTNGCGRALWPLFAVVPATHQRRSPICHDGHRRLILRSSKSNVLMPRQTTCASCRATM